MAWNEVRNGAVGIKDYCRTIERKTLSVKNKVRPVLDFENENILKYRNDKLQTYCFVSSPLCVKSIAYHLIKYLNMNQAERNGKHWVVAHVFKTTYRFQCFSFSVSNSQVSIPCPIVQRWSNKKSRNIFRIDETGLQINNRSSHIMGKSIHRNVMSSAKGETYNICIF